MSLQTGEVHHGVALSHGVNGHIIVESAHGLCGQVAALDDVVVEDIAQTLRVVLPVQPVLPVHEGGEGGHIGHLAADGPGFHLGAAQILTHLLHQQLLHPVNELGALIIEDVFVVEGFNFFMLGVPESGIRGTQQLYGPAGGILRGNQVDALLLPPHMVLGCPMEQIRCVGNPVAGAGSGSQMIQAVENGPGIGRGIHTHMVGGESLP